MENNQTHSAMQKDALQQDKHATPIWDVVVLILTALFPAILIMFMIGLSYLIIMNAFIEPYRLLLSNAGVTNYILQAFYVLIVMLIIPLLCLLIPAVCAFLINLVKPVMNSWLRAAFSGAVFLAFFVIPFIILVVLIEQSEFTKQVSINLIQIVVLGPLIGVGLSVSLALSGRKSAFLRIKKKLKKPDL